MPSHSSSSCLPQAGSSARSISFLSCVLRQFKYHSFPPIFSLHSSRCYDLGKFGAAPASLCFWQNENIFRLSKMFWTRHAFFTLIEEQNAWFLQLQFSRINCTSTPNKM